MFSPRSTHHFYLSTLGSCLLVLLLLVLTPRVAHAQVAGGEAVESPWTFGMALGQGRRSNPFVASDAVDIHAVIDLAWYGERFFFDNGDLGYTLHATPRFSLNAVLGFNNERNYFSYLGNGSSGIDILSLRQLAEDRGISASGILPEAGAGMGVESLSAQELEDFVFADIDSELPDRDFAANGGLELLYLSPWGDLQAQLFTDVSSTHNGQSAWLSYTYPWISPRTEYGLTLGLEWKSSELVDYYYGVTPAESLPGRAIYSGSAATNGVVRFAATHALSEHWKLVGVLEREYLHRSIHQSPIIKDHRVDTAFLGLYYAF